MHKNFACAIIKTQPYSLRASKESLDQKGGLKTPLNKYELLYIIESKLDDEKREQEIEKFNALIIKSGGNVEKVVKTAPWGLKKLAYPIDYKKEGFYVLVVFNALPTLIAQLEHNLKLSDNVMRFKTMFIS